MAEARFVTYLDTSFPDEEGLIIFLKGLGRNARQRWIREALIRQLEGGVDPLPSRALPSQELPIGIRNPSLKKERPTKRTEKVEKEAPKKKLLGAHLSSN